MPLISRVSLSSYLRVGEEYQLPPTMVTGDQPEPWSSMIPWACERSQPRLGANMRPSASSEPDKILTTLIKRLFSSSSLSAIRWYNLHIWSCWYFSWQSWFQLVIHPAQHLARCTLHMDNLEFKQVWGTHKSLMHYYSDFYILKHSEWKNFPISINCYDKKSSLTDELLIFLKNNMIRNFSLLGGLSSTGLSHQSFLDLHYSNDNFKSESFY